ncbi:hypothetical protein [Mesorhizobium sp. M0228]|uniref:hypothetical protein n=1 Tax=Mesorhizobium sp. M0228 TaxID=2956923 RepID=UPI0033397DF7
MTMAAYSWHEIGDVPAKPGVYAWYYTPEITSFDLEQITTRVTTLKASVSMVAAREAVRAFLDESVFRYFREQPYSAQLRGPLKPRYEGTIEHMPSLSESLLDRIVEEPARLATIREVLEASAPHFASPIYIGMSEKLRLRLKRHKALIEKYGELPDIGLSEEEQRDQSFAREVRARNIPPSRLFVVATVISGPPGTYVDIENILNRIHYPLLGRN